MLLRLINNYSPKWRGRAVDIYRAAKRFSIYKNSEIIYTKKLISMISSVVTMQTGTPFSLELLGSK